MQFKDLTVFESLKNSPSGVAGFRTSESAGVGLLQFPEEKTLKSFGFWGVGFLGFRV